MLLRRALGLLILAGFASVSVRAQQSAASTAPPWQPVGPAQILSPAYGALSGRVGSLALDPSDATGNTLYVGALGGGVWKATNAASSSPTFSPLTDSLSVWQSGATPSLSIGAITVQSRTNGVVLAGTGDANNAVDSHYGSGILRSTDGGATWSLIQNTQDGFNGGRANFSFIGDGFNGFAWSGQTPDLVVAAVGGSANATNVARTGFSVRGLFYSTDAGMTWQLATIRDSATAVVQSNQTDFSAYAGNTATAVVWNPIRKRFYAAVRYHGYYDSTDGMTWTRLAAQPGAGLTTLFCPTNPGLPASTQCPILRGALAVDASTGDTFALSVDAQNTDQGLWRDICNQNSGNCAAAVAFSSRLDTGALETSKTDTRIVGGDYALTLATVHAATDTLLFAGTQDLFRCSVADGCTWRNTTNALGCAAAGVAFAQHAIASVGNTMFFATDGGVWRTTDAVAQTQRVCSGDDAAHFQNLNADLGSLAEITSFAQHPTDSAILLASAGRNGIAGTASLTTTEWAQISTSPFNPVAIDAKTPANWYAETNAGVNISRCAGGTGCLQTKFTDPPVIVSAQVSGDEAALNAPFILDSADPTRALVGTCRLWRGAADGTAWSPANAISTMFDGHQQPKCDGNTLVRSIATTGPAAASGSKVVYVGMAAGGSVGGHLFSNYAADQATGSTVWTDVALSPVANDDANAGRFNAGSFDVSSVAVDPHDATGKTVYATIAGFTGNGISAPLVYRSTDGGAHWQNITSNLPDFPANALLVDALDANTVYVALDSGVYVTNSVTNCALVTANCWSSYLSGLPTTPVTSLSQITAGGKTVLRAGTLGRGVWQSGAVAIPTPGHITLSPTALTFANQTVGTTSATQSVTITNSGGSPVTVIALTVSPNFTASTACPTPLASQATCTIQVNFTPTAPGAITGMLSVSDGLQSQSVALNGTALANTSMTVSPTSLNFATLGVGTTSAAQSVTVTNTGGTALTEFSAATNGDFKIASGGSCKATIAANTSCSVKVAFAPTAAGSRIAALTLTARGVQSQSVTLTGTGADFSISVVGSASATIKAGKTAQYKVAVTPAAGSLGFATLTCSGLPAHTTCFADPNATSLTAASTVNVTVGTSSKAAAIRVAGGWLLLTVPFVFRLRGRRKISTSLGIVLATLSLGLVCGCGAGTAQLIGGPGSGGGGGATAPGSYTIVVLASSAGITRSVNLTLVVQ